MAAKAQPEARSLSTINYLAANPPQYPYHPEPKESLTLYISRVPGTQDIILSTLRPLRKNVTGEDVANSLYYIHLDTPQDGLLATENVPSPRSSGESARSAIPRKPVPGAAKVPGPGHEAGALPSPVAAPAAPAPAAVRGPPAFQPRAPGNTGAAPANVSLDARPAESIVEGYRENPMFRKRGLGAASDAPGSPRRPSSMPAPPPANPLQRKVLGLRPPSALMTLSRDSHVPDSRMQESPVTPTQSGPHTAHPAGQVAPITSPISHPHSQSHPDPHPHQQPHPHPHPHPDKALSPSRPNRAGQGPSSASFSLTVIRRDPTSATQCNVGKISSFQTNVPTPDAAGPNLDPDNLGVPQMQKIDIRLETSGYAKYRDMPSRASVDAFRPTVGQSFTQQVLLGAAAGSGGDKAASLKSARTASFGPVEQGFSRQVVMSYGFNWKSNFKKAFQRRDGPSSPERTSPEDPAQTRSSHARQGSASTTGSVDSADGKGSNAVFTQPGPGRKPKGYVFLSPWDGRCEFRTSTNGRTLKCRHILDSTNMKLGPREVAQSLRDAQAMGRSRGDELASALVGAKPVSELRFNLPKGARRRKVPDRDGASKAGRWDSSHLSGQFSKLLHHGPKNSDDEWDGSDYDDDEDDTPLDLSLAKEQAGGGHRGKRAKLGKLIIHDEGLKMLDLVVAANVGVWWTTWGRAV